MNSFTLFLTFAFCATLVWRTEAEECGSSDFHRCGNRCHGFNNTCTCGKQSWTWENDDQGCCPSSSDSCIQDRNGRSSLLEKRNKNPNFFIPFIFTGNVNCIQGSVMDIGEKCPAIHQCLTSYGWKSQLLCEDGTCSEKKYTSTICRGITNVVCKK